jgi:regulator of CtrA degradation
MSESNKTNENSVEADVTVDFGSRFAESELFNKIFREGMDLVEETASYLDGPGRADSRQLARMGAMAYATESMRLTTRLMQLASWLLLQRAVKDGELTANEAQKEKYRINLKEVGARAETEGSEDLPEALRELISRSFALYRRIVHLDDMLRNGPSQADARSANPVSDQVSRLQAAFGGLGSD